MIPNAIGVVTVDIPAGVAGDSVGYGNIEASQLTLGLPYDDDRDGQSAALRFSKPSVTTSAARSRHSMCLS